MSKVIGFVYFASWLNAHTEPPAGQPRVKAAVYLSCALTGRTGAGPTPPEIIAACQPLGSGYTVSLACIEPEPRRLPLASKQSIRRKRLAARLRKKVPMFADQLIAEEIKRRPEYFGEVKP